MARRKVKRSGLFGLFDGPEAKYPAPSPGHGNWSDFVEAILVADGRPPKRTVPDPKNNAVQLRSRSDVLAEILQNGGRGRSRLGRPKGSGDPVLAEIMTEYEMFEKALEDAGFKGKHGRLDKIVETILEQRKRKGLPIREPKTIRNKIKRAGRRNGSNKFNCR